MKITPLVSAGALLLLAFPAQAQIYNCDGKWTNKPCSGGAMEVLQEEPQSSKPQTADPGLSVKKSLFHELNMKAIEAKRAYNLRFDLSEIEALCLRPETSVSQCRERITVFNDRIDKKIAEQAAVKAQEEANKLQQQANKLQQQRNEIEASQTTVIVEENDLIEVVPRRPYIPGHYHDGLHHGRHGGSGISINAEGVTSDGTNTSVSGSAGGSIIGVPGHSRSPHHRTPRDHPSGHRTQPRQQNSVGASSFRDITSSPASGTGLGTPSRRR